MAMQLNLKIGADVVAQAIAQQIATAKDATVADLLALLNDSQVAPYINEIKLAQVLVAPKGKRGPNTSTIKSADAGPLADKIFEHYTKRLQAANKALTLVEMREGLDGDLSGVIGSSTVTKALNKLLDASGWVKGKQGVANTFSLSAEKPKVVSRK